MSFLNLAKGDTAYTVHCHAGRIYAIAERVLGVTACFVRTIPCYADGTPMILFGTTWDRISGAEVDCPHDRSPMQLLLALPDGIDVVAVPRAA